MRYVKFFMVVMLIALMAVMTGCSCKARNAGTNVPSANSEGPLQDVHFGFDSDALDSIAKAKIDANAEWLMENSESRVNIEGHCDERGTNEYNMALGLRRARAAHDALVNKGISSDRISVVSYGEELPLDPAHNEAAWAQNRRAHFEVR